MIIKILVTILLSYMLIYSGKKCLESNNFKTFDAYEILNIEMGLTDKKIKRAFLDMAKKYHPDRNPGDPDANKKFMLINKAYQCLKTEESRANCETSGNPEGTKGAFEVGIALPPFLLKRENRLVILALFFILILIVLPVTVMYFYTSSEKLDQYGTRRSLFYHIIQLFRNENIQFKNFLELLSLSEEMIPILKVKKEQNKGLFKLMMQDKDFKPKMGLEKFKPFLKPFYVLNAYMNQRRIPEVLQDDLLFMLKKTINILNSLVDYSIEIYNADPRAIQQLIGKELKFEMINRLIFFSQHFYQSLVLHDPSVLQLPGVNKNNIDHFIKKFRKKVEMKYFLEKPENLENRQKLFKYFNNDEKKIEQLNKVFQCLPNIEIEPKIYVKINDELIDEDVHKGDVYTIDIKVKHLNKKIGYIHSKNFPFLKNETLFLIVQQISSKRIIFYKKILNNDEIFNETFQTFARDSGRINLKIYIKSDSYLGCDLEQEFSYEIMKDKKKEEFVIHPDDEKALKEESLFKTMMNELQQENSDEEEEEEEGEKKVEDEKKVEEEEEEIKETKD